MNFQVSELARTTGISRSTISRALNRPESVAPETLSAVHSAARSLNMDPRKRSRRGRPRKLPVAAGNGRLGVWFVGSGEKDAHRFLGEQIAFLQAASVAAGASFRLLFSANADEIPIDIRQQECEAILLQGAQPSPAVLDTIAGLPSVWVMTRKSPDYPGDYVEPDNEANGRMAADYLMGRKHSHLAYISVEPEYPAYARREASFTARVRELGGTVARITALPHIETVHLLPPPSEETGDQLAAQLFACAPAPTAIYMPDSGATGVLYRSIRRSGADPAQFDWIIGNYSPFIHTQLDPIPTAIDINLQTIIATAVQTVLWRATNPGLPGRIGIQISPALRRVETASPLNGSRKSHLVSKV